MSTISTTDLLADAALIDRELTRLVERVRFLETEAESATDHRLRVIGHELAALRVQRERFAERKEELRKALERPADYEL